jgi:hypothetical protein
MDDVFAVGDNVTVDKSLSGSITRIEIEDGEVQVYIRAHMSTHTMRPPGGQIIIENPPGDGPFTPQQVVPDRPSKGQEWRKRYGR